ncbi:MAG: hypothetical protein R2856_07765 [Caldilineaceae bacterium]
MYSGCCHACHRAGDATGVINQQLMVDESIRPGCWARTSPIRALETVMLHANPPTRRITCSRRSCRLLTTPNNGQSVASFHGSDCRWERSTRRGGWPSTPKCRELVLDLAETPSNGDPAAGGSAPSLWRRPARSRALLLIQHWDTLTAQTPGYEQAAFAFAHPAPVIVRAAVSGKVTGGRA